MALADQMLRVRDYPRLDQSRAKRVASGDHDAVSEKHPRTKG